MRRSQRRDRLVLLSLFLLQGWARPVDHSLMDTNRLFHLQDRKPHQIEFPMEVDRGQIEVGEAVHHESGELIILKMDNGVSLDVLSHVDQESAKAIQCGVGGAAPGTPCSSHRTATRAQRTA